MKEYLCVFNSTHHAIKFESTMKEKGMPLTIIPVPREISASCGLAVKLSCEIKNLINNIKQYELNVGLIYEVVHLKEGKSYILVEA